MSQNKIILLDMDGVLTDFVGNALRVFGREDLVITQEDMIIELGVNEEEFCNGIDTKGEEFWAMMPETPECNSIINLVESTGFQWLISTNPSKYKYASAGKEYWLKNKFGYNFTNYMIGKHKYLMAGPDRVLIDDFAKNCHKFMKYGGDFILVPRPYNSLSNVDTLTYITKCLNKYLYEN